MSTCPDCAESFGWRQVLRHDPCSECGALLDAGGGRLRTFASENVWLLDAPMGADQQAWLVAAAITTAAVSWIPGGPIIAGIVQGFCLEKVVRRYKEHVGFFHSTVIDFFAAILLGALTFGQIMASLAGPLAIPINLSVLALDVWVYYRYCRWHFRRSSEGLRPHPFEMAVVGTFIFLVLIPPLMLFVVFLAVFLQHRLAA